MIKRTISILTSFVSEDTIAIANDKCYFDINSMHLHINSMDKVVDVNSIEYGTKEFIYLDSLLIHRKHIKKDSIVNENNYTKLKEKKIKNIYLDFNSDCKEEYYNQFGLG
jgi:hypothetical protein